MIDYELKELFEKDSVNKQMQISYSDGLLTNSELLMESFVLKESICSEQQLTFGCCEASSIEFEVMDVNRRLKNELLDVQTILDGNSDKPFKFGRYKVFSSVPTADRNRRAITAYDKMYDIINMDVATWYNALTFPMTIKAFRDSFCQFVGVDQVSVDLIQDSVEITKTIDAEKISGKDILSAIGEINGVFPHINREDKLTYITLISNKDGVFPSNKLYPSDLLFPVNANTETISKSLYTFCDYEDFETEKISKLLIRTNENDVGVTSGYGDNQYTIEGNFLILGKSNEELQEISDRLFNKISGIYYRPATISCVGNPCREVGDAIRVNTSQEIVNTFVLERTLSGIQALYDEVSAKGVEKYDAQVNSLVSSFKAIQGKTNELTRTIEETKSTITDLSTELHDNYSTTTDMRSEITQTADSIKLEVSQTYTTQQDFRELQNDVYGNITTYEGSEVPTLSNYPANAWTTEEERNRHVGALYIINSDNEEQAGQQYRFSKPSSGWGWYLIANSDVTKALKDAQDALFLASQTADNLSVNYYTNQETDSAIQQSATNITSTVSATYSTKAEVKGFVDGIEETIGNYSTTEEMKSAINQSAESIEQSVSKTYQTISDMSRYATNSKVNEDIQTVESKITQTANSISLGVTNGAIGKTAGIKISITDPITGGTKEASGNIDLTGAVKFSDLSGNGTTTINGANIKTGNINCDRLNGGTIKGQNIIGCNISGSALTTEKALYMTYNAIAPYEALGTSGNPGFNPLRVGHGFSSVDIKNLTLSGNSECNATFSSSELRTNSTGTASAYNANLTSSGLIRKAAGSSRRWKKDITKNINEENAPEKLYDLDIVQYKYRKGHLEEGSHLEGKDIVGFIAEDVYALYPNAAMCQFDDNGKVLVNDWNAQNIIPPMMKLIQDQHKEIEKLKERLNKLEKALS